jgi:hypothetical protein
MILIRNIYIIILSCRIQALAVKSKHLRKAVASDRADPMMMSDGTAVTTDIGATNAASSKRELETAFQNSRHEDSFSGSGEAPSSSTSTSPFSGYMGIQAEDKQTATSKRLQEDNDEEGSKQQATRAFGWSSPSSIKNYFE